MSQERIISPYENGLLASKQCPICYSRHMLHPLGAYGEWCKSCGTLFSAATNPPIARVPTISED